MKLTLHILAVSFFFAALVFVVLMATSTIIALLGKNRMSEPSDPDELLLTRKVGGGTADHADGGNA